jgi:hypothetical protein
VALRGHQQDLPPRHPLHGTINSRYYLFFIYYSIIILLLFYFLFFI